MDLLVGALPAFLASLVEFVEALTIVLVVGVTRGWRGSLAGAAGAVLVLAGVVGLFGSAVGRIDKRTFEVVVGTLLLLFGLRWIRKAILRYAGVVAMHDEALIFAREQSRLGTLRSGGGGRPAGRLAGFDWGGAVVSFKATALEGLEVIFIVLALGAHGRGTLQSASLGAGAALVVVVGAGAALRAPLSRVPENTLKFAVGAMLCSFGVFWSAEGMGVGWPGDAAALLVLVPASVLLAGVAVLLARQAAEA